MKKETSPNFILSFQNTKKIIGKRTHIFPFFDEIANYDILSKLYRNHVL